MAAVGDVYRRHYASLVVDSVDDPGHLSRQVIAGRTIVRNHKRKDPSLFEKGPLALVAGEGFEPSTSGL